MPPKKTKKVEDAAAPPPISAAAGFSSSATSDSSHKLHMDLRALCEQPRNMLALGINSLRRRRALNPHGDGATPSNNNSGTKKSKSGGADAAASGGKKKPSAKKTGGKKGGAKKEQQSDSDDDSDDHASEKVPIALEASIPADCFGWLSLEEAESTVQNMEPLLKHLRDALQHGDRGSATAILQLVVEAVEGPFAADVHCAFVTSVTEPVAQLVSEIFRFAFEAGVAVTREFEDATRVDILAVIMLMGSLVQDAGSEQRARVDECRTRLCQTLSRRMLNVLRERALSDAALTECMYIASNIDKMTKEMMQSQKNDDGEESDCGVAARREETIALEKQRLQQKQQEHKVHRARVDWGFDVFRIVNTCLIKFVTCNTQAKAIIAKDSACLALTFIHSHDIVLQVSALETIYRITRSSPVYFQSMPMLPENVQHALRNMPADGSVLARFNPITHNFNLSRRPRAVQAFVALDIAAGDGEARRSFTCGQKATVIFTPQYMFIVPSAAAEGMSEPEDSSPALTADDDNDVDGSSRSNHDDESSKIVARTLCHSATVPLFCVRSVRMTPHGNSARIRLRQAPQDLKECIVCAPNSLQQQQLPEPESSSSASSSLNDLRDSIVIQFAPQYLGPFKASPVRLWLLDALKAATQKESGAGLQRQRPAGAEDAALGSVSVEMPSTSAGAQRNTSSSVFFPSMSLSGNNNNNNNNNAQHVSSTPGFAATAGGFSLQLGQPSSALRNIPATELRITGNDADAAASANSGGKKAAGKKSHNNNNNNNNKNTKKGDANEQTPMRPDDKLLDAAIAGADKQLLLHVSPSPMPKNPKNKAMSAVVPAAVAAAPAPQPKSAAATAAGGKKTAAAAKKAVADAAPSSSDSDEESDDVALGDLMASKKKQQTQRSVTAGAASSNNNKNNNNNNNNIRVESEPPFEVKLPGTKSNNNNNQSIASNSNSGNNPCGQQAPIATADAVNQFRAVVEQRVATFKQRGVATLHETLGRIQAALTQSKQEWDARCDDMASVFGTELQKLHGEEEKLSGRMMQAVQDMNGVLCKHKSQWEAANDTINVLEMQCGSVTQSLRQQENGRVAAMRQGVEAEVGDIQALFNQRMSSVNPLQALSEFITRNVAATTI